MRYETDRGSRTRAIVLYAIILCTGGAIGLMVRAGIITDHILW